MEQVFTTVSSKGQMVIPAKFRESMEIERGTRIAIHQEGSRLILEPKTFATRLRLIDELCGLTAGGPSMCDMLLEERRQDRARELERDGW